MPEFQYKQYVHVSDATIMPLTASTAKRRIALARGFVPVNEEKCHAGQCVEDELGDGTAGIIMELRPI